MSQCYFVPLHQLTSRLQEKLNQLDNSLDLEGVIKIEPGQSYTVSLESFAIANAQESDGNDLLVRTTTKNLENNSEVTVLNCFEKDIPAGKTIDNLLSEHIYAVKKPDKPLSLKIKTVITEVNHTSIDGEDDVLQAVKSIADLLGAAFPSLMVPYLGVGSKILNGFRTLIKETKRSENIFNCELQLDDRSQTAAGAYIFFQDHAENIENKYKLRGLRLEKDISDSNSKIIDDYLIIKLVPGIVCAGGEEDLLSNQQLATVLQELDTSELSNQEVRDKLFVFLKETLTNFMDKNDLDYIQKIYNHLNLGETLVSLDKEHWESIKDRIGELFPQLLIKKVSQLFSEAN